ncbi:uncharacterized protein METZ01_LOCUS385045 [marine metagenome]|uniref:Thioredoxin domain-containing protein n=1 Tax=marine metagenome TaxID=408172 RepID=A0A382UEN1_9ZZZZ
MALAEGTKAPDFTLKTKTVDGLSDVTLSDRIGDGKTVLIFFPLAFTTPCTNEMCSIQDSIQEYSDLDATIIGVSVDSPFTQEEFARKNNLGFTLVSDFNKEVSAAYDVLYENLLGLRGVAKRSVFVIDSEGVIQYSMSNEDPMVLPDFDALKAALN